MEKEGESGMPSALASGHIQRPHTGGNKEPLVLSSPEHRRAPPRPRREEEVLQVLVLVLVPVLSNGP